MCITANPLESQSNYDTTQKQTVEMRSPDGSADLYQLIAGLAVACRHGFELENALDIAEKTYVNVNIHQKEKRRQTKSIWHNCPTVVLLPLNVCNNNVRYLKNIMYSVRP